MEYNCIVIRYGEISTKGRNRNVFVEKLKNSIVPVLTSFPKIKIKSGRDRMYILLNGENAKGITEKLKKIFGIQSFSPALKVKKELETMKRAALELAGTFIQEGSSFKITAKRADKSFELDTNEMNQLFGELILENISGIKVDVKNPSLNLQIEVRKEASYLSCETIQGAGGLPVGSSGKAVLMLSGGIDSPVAGYLAMKRGVEIEAVHFFSPPYTSERAKEKVIDLAKKLSEISGTLKLHIVPFTAVQQAVREQVPENYTMTSTRRFMLRITDQIRKRRAAMAIITGESIGQVASQTIESMYAINQVTNTPVLRPLISMDKTDIIKRAKEIDTYDISIRPYEDCCTIFVPAAPKTKPRREKVQFYESFFDFEPLIQQAAEQAETLEITPDYHGLSTFDELF